LAYYGLVTYSGAVNPLRNYGNAKPY